MLIAGKGLGEDVTNGAAARPVVAAREGRPREDRAREKRKGGSRDEDEDEGLEPISSEGGRGRRSAVAGGGGGQGGGRRAPSESRGELRTERVGFGGGSGGKKNVVFVGN